jgi:hypothetical protein
VRIWVSYGQFALETLPTTYADFSGVGLGYSASGWVGGCGRFNLINAYDLDLTLKLAEQYGIYFIFVIGEEEMNLNTNFNNTYSFYNKNKYPNFGTIDNPRDFWSDENTRKIYKQKIQYIASRYGYSPNILCWEFANEVDNIRIPFRPHKLETEFNNEIIDCLKEYDINNHFITNSYGTPWSIDPQFFNKDDVGFVTIHKYNDNIISYLEKYLPNFYKAYKKPVILEETGNDWNVPDYRNYVIHEAFWISLMFQIGCMPWDTDKMDGRNTLKEYKILQDFIKDIDFPREQFLSIKDIDVQFKNSDDKAINDIILNTNQMLAWTPNTLNNQEIFVTISDQITITDKNNRTALIGKILHGIPGAWHGDKYNPITINIIEPPVLDYKLLVNIESANYTEIEFYADEILLSDYTISVGQSENYSGIYEVIIPGNTKKIKISNIGPQSSSIVDYRFIDIKESNIPNIKSYGLQGNNTTIMWLTNMHNTYYGSSNFNSETDVKPLILNCHSIKPGNYQMQVLNTFTGDILKEEKITIDNKVETELPLFEKDIAIKLIRL